MKTEEMKIKIRDKNLMLTLVKNDLCDEGWLDLTIENIENGKCTSYGIEEAEILQALMPLIDTSWVLEDSENE